MMKKITALVAATALHGLALAGGPAAGVPGEKLDSGLGDLPHYSQWADPTGKSPMAKPAATAPAARKKSAAAEPAADRPADTRAVRVSSAR